MKETYAVDNWAVASKALEAWLPECRNMRIAGNLAPGPGHFSASLDKYVVRGDLPSGREYEVPIEIDIVALYYDEPVGAWLNSTELARELKKAVRAFKVAVALDGAQSAHRPLFQNSFCDCERCRERKTDSRTMQVVGYGFAGKSGSMFGMKDLAVIEEHQHQAIEEMSRELDKLWK